MVWAEFIADMIAISVTEANGGPIPLSPRTHLHDAFADNMIHVGAIGYFCSHTQFTAFPENTPIPLKNISKLLGKQMTKKEFWKLDQDLLDQITEQLELLRK